MSKKRDTASDRLRSHIEIESNRIAHQLGLVDDSVALGSAYENAAMYEESDWYSPEIRSIAANDAITIDARDVALKKAFEKFGLQDKNPFHWRKLIYYFSDAHFGSQKRPGRRAVWSDGKLCGLLQDIDEVRRHYRVLPGSKATDLRLCELLTTDSKQNGKYSEFAPKTILRNLQRARNPNENKILGRLVSNVAEPLIAEMRVAAKAKGVKFELKWEKAALVAVIKMLSKKTVTKL
jgi:hypothetical protein